MISQPDLLRLVLVATEFRRSPMFKLIVDVAYWHIPDIQSATDPYDRYVQKPPS